MASFARVFGGVLIGIALLVGIPAYRQATYWGFEQASSSIAVAAVLMAFGALLIILGSRGVAKTKTKTGTANGVVDASSIAKQRLAAGEITRAEYDEIASAIEGD